MPSRSPGATAPRGIWTGCDPLAEHGTVSRQTLDAARAAADAAAGRREAARQALQLLREGTRPERVQAARAEVASARAARCGRALGCAGAAC